MTFTEFVDKAFWGITIALFAWAVGEIKSLNTSVQALNTNVAVILTDNAYTKQDTADLKARVLALEHARSK